jgi:hypothetical protein
MCVEAGVGGWQRWMEDWARRVLTRDLLTQEVAFLGVHLRK